MSQALRHVAQVASSSLSIAGWNPGSAYDEAARRLQGHVSGDLFDELVALGERIYARQRSQIGKAKLPFHVLVQDALGDET